MTKVEDVLERVKAAATLDDGIRIMVEEYGGEADWYRQGVLWARGLGVDDVIISVGVTL